MGGILNWCRALDELKPAMSMSMPIQCAVVHTFIALIAHRSATRIDAHPSHIQDTHVANEVSNNISTPVRS